MTDIRYLNTDLELMSAEDLSELAAVLEASGVSPMHVTQAEDGLWYAMFETNESFPEPEVNIAAMLSAIESLSESFMDVWLSCTQREFNIGYDCGDKPWAFNNGFSNETLRRIGAAGATLRFTLYPPEKSCERSD